MSFNGLRDVAPGFFAMLAQDNRREVFQAHHAVYQEQIRAPFLALLAALPGDPARWRVYRPTRDTRFSRDKAPYKTFIGAIAPGPGAVGRYVMLDADGLFVATGAPMFARDQLERYRAAVADEVAGSELARLVAALRDAGRRVKPGRWEPLKSAPKGYPRDHPRIELLRWKGVEVPTRVGAPDWLATADAPARIVAIWERAAGIDAWLDTHVGASELDPAEIWGRGRGAGAPPRS